MEAVFALFQSTPPTRAATVDSPFTRSHSEFQSTPPTRAATNVSMHSGAAHAFQSTSPTRAATKADTLTIHPHKVSIHAAHAGGDLSFMCPHAGRSVSIHAAHAGGDKRRGR